MSRLLLVITIIGLVSGGLQADPLPSTQSWVSSLLSDAVGTASEGLAANATKSGLATEKKKLDQELCEAKKVPSAPTVETEKKPVTPKEGGKAVVTEHKTEKLPGNKTKEVVVTEEMEKLPSNATVKKTVERQVVKGADGKATGNETVIEKETMTDTSPSNGTVTQTVKEHKVVKGEEVTEQKTEEEKKELDKAVEPVEKPALEKLPVNATVKETSVEHKVVKEPSKDGESQKIVIDKETRTDIPKVTETPTVGIVNASVLDEKAGPKKIVMTKMKTEKFPDDKTKEVVVKEEAEKLPTNDTIKKIEVERKITKDTGKDSGTPQQETVTEKEVEKQITNKTTQAKAAGKCKTQQYKDKIANIKRQVQEVKEQIKDQENKTGKLVGALKPCVKRIKFEKPTKEPAEGKKVVETVIPAEKIMEVVREVIEKPVSEKPAPEKPVPEKPVPEKQLLPPNQTVILYPNVTKT